VIEIGTEIGIAKTENVIEIAIKIAGKIGIGEIVQRRLWNRQRNGDLEKPENLILI
jgi:hypothetical protein